MSALKNLRDQLRAAGAPDDARFLQRFFKTGPGEYAEGDVFIGVRVPVVRRLALQADALPLADVLRLLASRIHEERLLALVSMTRRFARGDEIVRREVYDAYLAHRDRINNWDLVDVSAPNIMGVWLLNHPRGILDALVESPVLWDRRIAVLATFSLLRACPFDDTVRLCTRLLGDPEDLMHKACGWMLRECGKRDLGVLRAFLRAHVSAMPRTMLRYAIEKLSPEERSEWLEGRPGHATGVDHSCRNSHWDRRLPGGSSRASPPPSLPSGA